MSVLELDRRDTLKVFLAAGGLTLAYSKGVLASKEEYGYQADGMTVPLIKVHSNNHVTIINPNADMGQGTSTSVPMIIAEELDLNWANVTIEQMPLKRHRNAKGQMQHTYVWQGSGGSGSIRRAWAALRTLGAQGRDMFLRAAAAHWQVSAEGLQTVNSHVINPATGERIEYAKLQNLKCRRITGFLVSQLGLKLAIQLLQASQCLGLMRRLMACCMSLLLGVPTFLAQLSL